MRNRLLVCQLWDPFGSIVSWLPPAVLLVTPESVSPCSRTLTSLIPRRSRIARAIGTSFGAPTEMTASRPDREEHRVHASSNPGEAPRGFIHRGNIYDRLEVPPRGELRSPLSTARDESLAGTRQSATATADLQVTAALGQQVEHQRPRSCVDTSSLILADEAPDGSLGARTGHDEQHLGLARQELVVSSLDSTPSTNIISAALPDDAVVSPMREQEAHTESIELKHGIRVPGRTLASPSFTPLPGRANDLGLAGATLTPNLALAMASDRPLVEASSGPFAACTTRDEQHPDLARQESPATSLDLAASLTAYLTGLLSPLTSLLASSRELAWSDGIDPNPLLASSRELALGDGDDPNSLLASLRELALSNGDDLRSLLASSRELAEGAGYDPLLASLRELALGNGENVPPHFGLTSSRELVLSDGENLTFLLATLLELAGCEGHCPMLASSRRLALGGGESPPFFIPFLYPTAGTIDSDADVPTLVDRAFTYLMQLVSSQELNPIVLLIGHVGGGCLCNSIPRGLELTPDPSSTPRGFSVGDGAMPTTDVSDLVGLDSAYFRHLLGVGDDTHAGPTTILENPTSIAVHHRDFETVRSITSFVNATRHIFTDLDTRLETARSTTRFVNATRHVFADPDTHLRSTSIAGVSSDLGAPRRWLPCQRCWSTDFYCACDVSRQWCVRCGRHWRTCECAEEPEIGAYTSAGGDDISPVHFDIPEHLTPAQRERVQMLLDRHFASYDLDAELPPRSVLSYVKIPTHLDAAFSTDDHTELVVPEYPDTDDLTVLHLRGSGKARQAQMPLEFRRCAPGVLNRMLTDQLLSPHMADDLRTYSCLKQAPKQLENGDWPTIEKGLPFSAPMFQKAYERARSQRKHDEMDSDACLLVYVIVDIMTQDAFRRFTGRRPLADHLRDLYLKDAMKMAHQANYSMAECPEPTPTRRSWIGRVDWLSLSMDERLYPPALIPLL